MIDCFSLGYLSQSDIILLFTRSSGSGILLCPKAKQSVILFIFEGVVSHANYLLGVLKQFLIFFISLATFYC